MIEHNIDFDDEMDVKSRVRFLPPRDILRKLLKERSDELLGKSENPRYEGPECRHGNPLGRCFDC